MKLNFMTKNVFNFFPKKIIDSVDNFSLISVGVKWETTTYINFFFGGGGVAKAYIDMLKESFYRSTPLKVPRMLLRWTPLRGCPAQEVPGPV